MYSIVRRIVSTCTDVAGSTSTRLNTSVEARARHTPRYAML